MATMPVRMALLSAIVLVATGCSDGSSGGEQPLETPPPAPTTTRADVATTGPAPPTTTSIDASTGDAAPGSSEAGPPSGHPAGVICDELGAEFVLLLAPVVALYEAVAIGDYAADPTLEVDVLSASNEDFAAITAAMTESNCGEGLFLVHAFAQWHLVEARTPAATVRKAELIRDSTSRVLEPGALPDHNAAMASVRADIEAAPRPAVPLPGPASSCTEIAAEAAELASWAVGAFAVFADFGAESAGDVDYFGRLDELNLRGLQLGCGPGAADLAVISSAEDIPARGFAQQLGVSLVVLGAWARYQQVAP